MSDRVAVGEYAAVIAEHFGVVHQPKFSRSVLKTEYADYERLFAVNAWDLINAR